MMPVPFNKTVTIYHKTQSDVGITWSRSVVQGVYMSTKRQEIINGNQRTYSLTHVIIIPEESYTKLREGDIVIEGIHTAGIANNASGNDIIALGGWFVRTVKDNRYPDSGVSHVYGSDGG